MKILGDSVKKQRMYIYAAVCAFCSACTFFMRYQPVHELSLVTNNWLYYHVYCVLEELKNACYVSDMALSLGMVGFFIFYLWFFTHPEYQINMKFKNLISLIFSFFSVSGTIILRRIDWSTSGQIVKMCIAFAGGYFFYNAILQIVCIVLAKDHQFSLPFISDKIKSFFWKRPGMFTFVFLLCCWIIPILLKYPAGICTDVARQIDQGLGYTELTAHHPVFHTMFMTWFVKLGMSIGSANLGIFLFCLVEAVVMAAIFGFILSVLVKLSAYKWVLAVAMLFFAFSPYITGYVGTPIKDLYFAAMVCIYVICLFVYSIKLEMFWRERKYPILFVLSSIGMALFRNNGIYICLLTGIVMVIYEIIKRGTKAMWRGIVILLAILLPFSSAKIVDQIYQPVPGSIREALSIPFQQTARYVTQHGDEVTAEERAAINEVLPYDDLAELYNPYISDPVKNKFNDNASSDDLKEYFQVWFQQFLKHPGCYVKAVYVQNVFLLYPQYNNYKYYLDTSPFENISSLSVDNINTPEVLKKIQVVYMQVLELAHKLPVLNLINNMAVYIMIMFVLCVLIIHKKNYSHLFYYLPLIISVLIIIAAPCIRGHVRYAYPVIYTFPIWLAGVARKER